MKEFHMEKDNSNCYYHPEKAAIAYCEKCGRNLCIQCKKIYRRYHSSTNYHRGYAERYEYCPICKYNEEERTLFFSSFSLIGFGVLVLIISTVFFSGAPSDPFFEDSVNAGKAMFTIFALIPLIGGLLKLFLFDQAKKAEIIENRNRFAKGVDLDQDFNRKSLPKSNSKTKIVNYSDGIVEKGFFYCIQCGEKLTKKIKYCPNCGDSTSDELANMKKEINFFFILRNAI